MSQINSTQSKCEVPNKVVQENWNKVFNKTKMERFLESKEDEKTEVEEKSNDK